MTVNPRDALDPLISVLRQQKQASSHAPRPFRLATVTSITGGTFVQFDGDSAAAVVSFTRLSSYTPVLNDRVLMARVGSTWTILGKVVA